MTGICVGKLRHDCPDGGGRSLNRGEKLEGVENNPLPLLDSSATLSAERQHP